MELVSGAMDRGAHDGHGAMPVSSGVHDGASQWPCEKGLTSHPAPCAQLGAGSVHVDAVRPTAPLALAVAPPAILDHLRGAVLRIGQVRMVPGEL